MVGKKLSHYQILSELGRGGMGVVYKATDTRLDRTVAIKVLPHDMTRDHVAKTRFIHEAKAASALDHSNICTVHAIEETSEGHLFIVMAYYEGSSLQDLIDENSLSIEQALDICIQLGRGLSKAHSNDIVHRDIKPANVMITQDDQVKIVDFGLAKVAELTQVTQEGSTLGTASYMSPEQARGETVDARTDQWSMGAVLYEMLSGQKAFGGAYSQAIIYSLLNEEPDAVRKLNPEVSADLANVVERMLKKEAKDRFASVEEATDALQRLLNRERGIESGSFDAQQFMHAVRAPRFSIPALLVLVLIVYAFFQYSSNQREVQRVRTVLIPEIEQLMESTWADFYDVYKLASEAQGIIPGDSLVQSVIDASTRLVDINTQPPGADVYLKAYAHPDEEWEFVGTTPITDERLPITVFRWKFEKEGYQPVFAATTSWALDPIGNELIIGTEVHRTLDPVSEIPEGMVRVEGIVRPDGVEIADFYIDRTEVTNEKYREFVTAGGYRNRTLWEDEFVLDGEHISWKEGTALMVDQTGRPGPPTWRAGYYPEGQDTYPVSGISWYEAAAYAKWMGKVLPTGAHWGRARGDFTALIQWPQLGGFAIFAPFSNFGLTGPVAVASMPGITSFGAFDMAGNVREWCFNTTDLGHLIRGAAWNDNTYRFSGSSQAPAFDRSSKNGIRLAIYPGITELAEEILTPEVLISPPDFDNVEVVSDDIFEVYRQQFFYDDLPLNTLVESTKEGPDWILERVSYDTPYNDERIIGNLFLPKNVEPPYQTVIYFPGSASLFQTSSEHIDSYYEFPVFLSFLLKNGRAVLYPTYEGTFERHNPQLISIYTGQTSFAYTTHVTHIVKDFMRSVDFLGTRDDIDMDRLAFYGMSWGGIYGGIIPAVDDRVKTQILMPPILHDAGRPEVNQINYVGRITIPTLMLAGEYDTLSPPESAVIPMYERLGTPDEHKMLIFYPTDHIPPMNEVIREVLGWLDIYLGPVN